MDWFNRVVIEKQIDEAYWNDIIKGRLETGDFYNIKFLKKEGSKVQEYFDFLVLLEEEMNEIQNIQIKDLVEKRVEDFKIQVEQEEQEKKDFAIAKKQAEIDAINRLIARMQHTGEDKETEE